MAGSDQRVSLQLQSTVPDTARLHAWLDEVLDGAPEQAAHAARLCLEEAVMNIVMHGYPQQAPGPIEVTLWREPELLFACVADSAPPFDATQARPSQQGTVEAGPLGGRGLILMRRYTSVLRYDRIGGQNRLTMGFKL